MRTQAKEKILKRRQNLLKISLNSLFQEDNYAIVKLLDTTWLIIVCNAGKLYVNKKEKVHVYSVELGLIEMSIMRLRRAQSQHMK